jgi:hypothetical protein
MSSEQRRLGPNRRDPKIMKGTDTVEWITNRVERVLSADGFNKDNGLCLERE